MENNCISQETNNKYRIYYRISPVFNWGIDWKQKKNNWIQNPIVEPEIVNMYIIDLINESLKYEAFKVKAVYRFL